MWKWDVIVNKKRNKGRLCLILIVLEVVCSFKGLNFLKILILKCNNTSLLFDYKY